MFDLIPFKKNKKITLKSKKLLVFQSLFLLLFSAIVASSIKTTFNQEQPIKADYGERVLNPRPKELRWEAGVFMLSADDRIVVPADATARTRKTAGFMAARLFGQYGFHLPIAAGDEGGRIKMRIDLEVVKKAIKQGDPAEAFLIEVTPEHVELIGADEPGLYYAVVTLNQVMRCMHQPRSPIPAVTIADWPSFHQRAYVEWGIGQGTGKMIDPNDFKLFLARVVAGSKYNMFMFTVTDEFVYGKHPMLTKTPLLAPKRYREIADFAREHFIEVVPGTLYGAHSRWVTRAYPDLCESDYGPNQMDMTKPEVYPMMRDIYGEILEAAGPRAKRFFIWHDEWWHRPAKKSRPSLTLNGMSRQEIFYRDLIENYEYLKSRGIRMMMWMDMIDPEHNGRPPFNLSKIAEKLPRDIIMISWYNSPAWLKKMGFETMSIHNGFAGAPGPGGLEYLSGYGTLAYTCQHSLFSWVSDSRAEKFSWHSTLRAAEAGWNLNRAPNYSLSQWVRRYMPNLMATYGLADNPQGGDKIETVTLSTDASLAKTLELTGTRRIGGVPLQLSAELVSAAHPVTVVFDQSKHASSLILLHGVRFQDNAARSEAHKVAQKYPYGLPVAELRITYADGTTARHSFRLGVDTIDMAGGLANRYVFFGRAVYELSEEKAMLETEWVNPYPDRAIESVEIVNTWKDAPLLLGGLSLRNVASGFSIQAKDDMERQRP